MRKTLLIYLVILSVINSTHANLLNEARQDYIQDAERLREQATAMTKSFFEYSDILDEYEIIEGKEHLESNDGAEDRTISLAPKYNNGKNQVFSIKIGKVYPYALTKLSLAIRVTENDYTIGITRFDIDFEDDPESINEEIYSSLRRLVERMSQSSEFLSREDLRGKKRIVDILRFSSLALAIATVAHIYWTLLSHKNSRIKAFAIIPLVVATIYSIREKIKREKQYDLHEMKLYRLSHPPLGGE